VFRDEIDDGPHVNARHQDGGYRAIMAHIRRQGQILALASRYPFQLFPLRVEAGVHSQVPYTLNPAPQTSHPDLHFEPSQDALSIRSDVISSKRFSLNASPHTRRSHDSYCKNTADVDAALA